jgi:hypothetical protein
VRIVTLKRARVNDYGVVSMPTPSPSNNSHREQVFIDKLIGSRRGRPERFSEFSRQLKSEIDTIIFRSKPCARLRPRWRCHCPESTASRRSTRSSTCSRGQEHELHLPRHGPVNTRGSRNLLQGARLELGLGLDRDETPIHKPSAVAGAIRRSCPSLRKSHRLKHAIARQE